MSNSAANAKQDNQEQNKKVKLLEQQQEQNQNDKEVVLQGFYIEPLQDKDVAAFSELPREEKWNPGFENNYVNEIFDPKDTHAIFYSKFGAREDSISTYVRVKTVKLQAPVHGTAATSRSRTGDLCHWCRKTSLDQSHNSTTSHNSGNIMTASQPASFTQSQRGLVGMFLIVNRCRSDDLATKSGPASPAEARRPPREEPKSCIESQQRRSKNLG